MKLGVLASRSIKGSEAQNCIDYAVRMMEKSLNEDGDMYTVLCGSGSEVEKGLKSVAEDLSYDVVLFEPYFIVDKKAKHNPAHFFARNRQIVDNSDKVLIFWDKSDRGEEFASSYANKKKKDVELITVE